MSQPDHPSFGDWLAARIAEAGYRSPSAFAQAAGLQPSMVLRWIAGKVQPTPTGLLAAAKALRIRSGEMLARGLGIPDLEESHVLHPLAVRVNRLLDEEMVPKGEKEMLVEVLDRILTRTEDKYIRLIAVSWDPPEKPSEGNRS